MDRYFGKIIDAHTHIFPPKIAEKASKSVGDFYELPMRFVGREDVLTDIMKQNGVKHSFILSIATIPSQVRNINDFLIDVIARTSKDNIFTAFGTVHPLMENPADEIDYMLKNGIKGIKFHHDFQKVRADAPCMFPIYEKAQAEKIPVFLHAGDNRYDYTNPQMLLNVYKNFPSLIAIAAHFGGYSVWDEVYEILCNTNFYFDTSSSLFTLNPSLAKKIINKHGAEKILFGTDFPMWRVLDEYKYIIDLGLSEDINQKILYRNAEELLSNISKNAKLTKN